MEEHYTQTRNTTANEPVQMVSSTNNEKRCKFKTLQFDFSTYQIGKNYDKHLEKQKFINMLRKG